MSIAHKSLLLRIITRAVALAIAIYIAHDLPSPFKGFSFDWLSVLQLAFGLIFLGLPLYAASKLWFAKGEASIRWLCSIATFIILIFWPGVQNQEFGKVFINSLSEFTANQDLLVIIRTSMCCVPTIAAFGFYALAKSWLMEFFELTDDRSSDQKLRAAKTYFGLLVFLLFGQGGEASPHSSGPWSLEFLIIFTPLILAVIIYKIGMHRVKQRYKNSRTEPTPIESSRPALQ